MTLSRISVAIVSIALVAKIGFGAVPSESDAIAAAEKIAKAFLTAVDAGNQRTAAGMAFDAEHKDPKSGRVRKAPMMSEAQLSSLIDARKRFGRLVERRFERAAVQDSHGRLPLGQYVQLTYTLRFEKKDRVTEIITVKIDQPQKGKVVSYLGG